MGGDWPYLWKQRLSNTISRFRRWWKMRLSATVFCIFECASGCIDWLRQISYSRHDCNLAKSEAFISRATPGDTIAGICMNSSICLSHSLVCRIINGICCFVVRVYYTLHDISSILRYYDERYRCNWHSFFSYCVAKIFFFFFYRVTKIFFSWFIAVFVVYLCSLRRINLAIRILLYH